MPYFIIYENMGAERSLIKLSKLVRGLGVKITAKTFMRWSSRFGWQKRLLEGVKCKHCGKIT